MSLLIIIIVIFIILATTSYLFISRKKPKYKRIIISLGAISVLACFLYFIYTKYQFNELRKYGFDYEITGDTWDTINFFYIGANQKKIDGPLIAGDRLTVKCNDVDEDGIKEFIIQSKVWKTYRTVLKVDTTTGSYHILLTKGLKVNYPQEGYFFN
jgi:hypothetical protein